MKASVIRELAQNHDAAALEEAADQLAEGNPLDIEVRGDDEGEKLTHLMLAARLRRRFDSGEDEREAFRALMAEVRDVVRND